MRIAIDIDKKTIIIDSPILIYDLIDKLNEWNIDFNEYLLNIENREQIKEIIKEQE